MVTTVTDFQMERAVSLNKDHLVMKSKVLKFALVCLTCLALIAGLVYLIRWISA